MRILLLPEQATKLSSEFTLLRLEAPQFQYYHAETTPIFNTSGGIA
jgi:hypothetical protein